VIIIIERERCMQNNLFSQVQSVARTTLHPVRIPENVQRMLNSINQQTYSAIAYNLVNSK